VIDLNPDNVVAFVAQPAQRGQWCTRHRLPGPCRACGEEMMREAALSKIAREVMGRG
jgi:hypothetical protein